jgi:apolipoprotein N-acyltransferase
VFDKSHLKGAAGREAEPVVSASPLLAPRPLLALQLAGVAASALLLWAVFPPNRLGSDGAWFALVPLLLVLRHCAPRRAFWLGWAGGGLFWLCSLVWLWRLIANNGPWPLVVLGHLGLAAYCALYLALFAVAVAWVWQQVRRLESLPTRLLAAAVAEPLLWVGAEYLRGTLLSGFPWNPLGATQYDNLRVIQVASLGGVAAVSLVVMLGNSAAASMAERIYDTVRNRTYGDPLIGGRLRGLETFLPLSVVIGAVLWGQARMVSWQRQGRSDPAWLVALVQPNAPCIFERDDASKAEVRETLLRLTGEVAVTGPDLVVWPETALIESLPYEEFAVQLARDGARAAGAPLLTGAVEYHPGRGPGDAGQRFHNAAWLFATNGVKLGSYHKQHLVPFGEYIPGDRWFPFLQRLSPVGFSCQPGRESTLLRIPQRPRGGAPSAAVLVCSPLICFEDTVAPLARRAVRNGARMLVNLTNDAWFNGSIEPEQHLVQAVFRCVENGVPMVRAANTGVSAVITPLGGRQTLMRQGATSNFAGALPCVVPVREEVTPTRYTLYGDWTLGCPAAIVLIAVLVLAGWRRRPVPAACSGGEGAPADQPARHP